MCRDCADEGIFFLLAGKKNISHCARTCPVRVIFDEMEVMTEFDNLRCCDLRNMEEFGVVILRTASDWTGNKTKRAFRETRNLPFSKV